MTGLNFTAIRSQAELFGLIAGARIYNRVLSEAEIHRLYNEHKNVVSA